MAEAKHKIEAANRRTLKVVLWILLSAVILIFIVLTVKKFASEREKSEDLREQRTAAENAAKKADALNKQYSKPIKTGGDTDDERRYGYDVLYAHHGLMIMLIESKINIERPVITLEVINDSEEKMTASIEYASVEGLNRWPDFEVELEPGKSEKKEVDFNTDSFKNVTVKNIRLCFHVYNEDGSIDEYSKAVNIDYRKTNHTGWHAPSDYTGVYRSELYEFDASLFSYEAQDDCDYYRSTVYLRSENADDMVIAMTGYKLYDKKGNELSEDLSVAYFEAFMPGYTLTNRYIKLFVDKSVKQEDLGRIDIDAEIYPREEEITKDTEKEKVSFTVYFGMIVPMTDD